MWRTPARAKAWAKACTIVICDVVFKMITVNFKKWEIASMPCLHCWIAETYQHIVMLINHDAGVFWNDDR
jgi:hypothetical protein